MAKGYGKMVTEVKEHSQVSQLYHAWYLAGSDECYGEDSIDPSDDPVYKEMEHSQVSQLYHMWYLAGTEEGYAKDSIDPIDEPAHKEMSKNSTEQGGTTELHRDEDFDTHTQAYFKSIKGHGKKVTEGKECYAMGLAVTIEVTHWPLPRPTTGRGGKYLAPLTRPAPAPTGPGCWSPGLLEPRAAGAQDSLWVHGAGPPQGQDQQAAQGQGTGQGRQLPGEGDQLTAQKCT